MTNLHPRAGFVSLWLGLLLPVWAAMGVLAAGQAAPAMNVPAEQRKTAEKAFTDIYGADEAAALRSREPDDNMALAQKIALDARNDKLDPVLVEVMRDHAVNLLTMLRSVAGCQQAIALWQEEMRQPGADREAIQLKIVDLTQTAAKYTAMGAERMAAERRVMLALAELAEIQIKKRAIADGIKTLERIRQLLVRYDPSGAQELSTRVRILQPLSQREIRLTKLKKDFAAKPDDPALAAEIVKTLVLDWGDVMAVAPYLPVAAPDQVKGVAQLLAFEEGGEDLSKLPADEMRSLAEAYEVWAGDRQTQKWAQVLLYRRAVAAYSRVADQAQGMDSLRAKRSLTEAQDKLVTLEKEQAELLTALSGGLALGGTIYLSRISGFDLAEVKPFEPGATGLPRPDMQQLIQLSNGSFMAFSVLQGQIVPAGVQPGWRAVVSADLSGGWTVCPTVMTSPAQRVVMFPDLDGQSFWVWVNRQNKITLTRWYYDAARRDVVKYPNDLTGALPPKYGDERGMTLGADGALMVTSGETYQDGQRWMIRPRLLRYNMQKFGDWEADIPMFEPTDTWRQRPLPVYVDGVWYVYHQVGGKMDQMSWSKIVDDKVVELYRFKSSGYISQLIPGKGADLHFVWDHNGRVYISTWNGRAMSEEKYFVSWQKDWQRLQVNVYAYGDQLAALIIRSVQAPNDPAVKFQISTMFRSQGNWSSEKLAAGSENWLKNYGAWDPPGFRSNLNSLSVPVLLGDRDLKAVAEFKVAP